MESNVEVDKDDMFENIPWVTINWTINDFFSRKLCKSSEFNFQSKYFRLSLELITSRYAGSDSYEICIEYSDKTSNHILQLIIRSGFIGDIEEKEALSYVFIPNLNGRHCIWKASRKYLLDNYEKLKTLGQESESFTFFCMIDLTSEYVEEESDDFSNLELRDLISLSYDFASFLYEKNNKEESDMRFIRGESCYFVHIDILSARCLKFSEKIQDNNGNIVEVKNMDSTAIKQFLQYVYAGNFLNLTEDDALQLYTASFTYEFEALRRVCAKFLAVKLSEENVCPRLILANHYNDEDFKKDIISFLVKASKDFWGSQTWFKFCVNRPKLACEVYNAFEHIKILLKP